MSLMYASDALKETMANAEATASSILTDIGGLITTAAMDEKVFCEYIFHNNKLSKAAKAKVLATLLEFGYTVHETQPTQMEKGFITINWEEAK